MPTMLSLLVLFVVPNVLSWSIPCEDTPSFGWCNTSVPVQERVRQLISAMTLGEKIQQSSTFTPKTCPGIPRLSVPEYSYHSEGLHGLRNTFSNVQLNTTVFPQVTGMAATGNLSLIAAMGAAMALEARAVNSDMLRRGLGPFGRGGSLFFWSPTMNIGRDPRWGRFQESISEDPWMNGEYSVAFLRAFQAIDGKGYPAVAATCKHYLAYSLEGWNSSTRHNFNAVVSAQDISETYLPAFHQCITRGKPSQVMCSYNSLNGVPACADKTMLIDTLRTKWGFDGLVVSDQGAIENIFQPYPQGHGYAEDGPKGVAVAILAGCDQNDGPYYAQYLAQAVQECNVSEARIDEALTRVLTQRFRVGSFDPPGDVPWTATPTSVMEDAAHKALALQAARESIVLLNNSLNVLPLSRQLTRIALIGPLADQVEGLVGGKPDYHASHFVTYKEGLTNAVCSMESDVDYFVKGQHGVAAASAGDCCALCGASGTCEVFTFHNDKCFLKNSTSGRVHSPGRTSGTKPRTVVEYTAGCADSKCSSSADFDAAAKMAERADATILVLGIDAAQEHEGIDRTTIGLPGMQLQLAQRMQAASKKLVVVLANGGPLSSDWLRHHAATVVEVFEGGMFAGTALADTLFGVNNPSGALPFTVFPESYVDAVSLTDMSMRPSATSPGRTYRFYNGTPLWTFGHGLSYTTFSLKWSSPPRTEVELHPNVSVERHVVVTNTGRLPGAKVVHLYISEVTPRAILHSFSVAPPTTPPHKSLVGMQKVYLEAGESKTLTFSLDIVPQNDSWCAFCTVAGDGQRAVAPGEYALLAGSSKGEEIRSVVIVSARGPEVVPLM